LKTKDLVLRTGKCPGMGFFPGLGKLPGFRVAPIITKKYFKEIKKIKIKKLDMYIHYIYL